MDIDTLIAKYLDGESSSGEIDEINKWRNSSPEHEIMFRQSEEAWRLAHVSRIHVRPDKEKVWGGIQKVIARRYSLPVLMRAAGIAASVALVLGLALSHIMLGGRKNRMPEHPQTITLYVPGGVCSKIILPDSTVVWLNSSSTISYPNSFDENSRTVELIGEAFFDVTHDKTKPFIIQSGKLQVNVLGTSFNFKHYNEDSNAVLAVETGSVVLSVGSTATTTVEAGKYATVDSKSLKTEVHNIPVAGASKKKDAPDSSTTTRMIAKETYTDQFSSWRDYRMIFRDEPICDVLNQLSRRYNAEFEIRGDEIKDYIYTATFGDLSLEDILELLKLSAPIDYTIESLTSNKLNAYGKRKVTIYRK